MKHNLPFPKLPWKQISIVFAVVVLAIQLSVQLYLAKNDSQTTDEAIHLLAGYVYLKEQRFDFNSEHPPLAKTLAALPLLAIDPKIPDGPYWEEGKNFFYDGAWAHRDLGEAFLYKVGNNADQLLFWGRFPVVLLTVIMGISIYLIATKLWGWLGGMVAVGVYAFDPTIAAHGHLVTTDIAASLGMLLTVYAGWQLLDKFTGWRVLAFGASLGVALASKYSTLALLPILFVLLIVRLVIDPELRRRGRSLVVSAVGGLLVAWLVIAASYQFHLTPPPATSTVVEDVTTANHGNLPTGPRVEKANRLYSAIRPVLLPSNYLKGTFLVFRTVTLGRTAFLLGQTSNQGWWYYFPVLLLTKTPIPSLLILLAGICVVIRYPERRKIGGYILAAGLMYLGFTLTSKANIGLRHAMPVLPFLFVGAGATVYQTSKRGLYIIGLLLFWLLVNFAVIFPYYLPYYNELVGGSNSGYKISTDSNTDWGQDLKRIKQYVDEKGIDQPYLEYYWDGLSAGGYYGLTYKYASEFVPGRDKGYLIIGATNLHTQTFDWLKDYQPIDRITPSVLVYKFE